MTHDLERKNSKKSKNFKDKGKLILKKFSKFFKMLLESNHN